MAGGARGARMGGRGRGESGLPPRLHPRRLSSGPGHPRTEGAPTRNQSGDRPASRAGGAGGEQPSAKAGTRERAPLLSRVNQAACGSHAPERLPASNGRNRRTDAPRGRSSFIPEETTGVSGAEPSARPPHRSEWAARGPDRFPRVKRDWELKHTVKTFSGALNPRFQVGVPGPRAAERGRLLCLGRRIPCRSPGCGVSRAQRSSVSPCKRLRPH